MKSRDFMENIVKAIQVSLKNIALPLGQNLLPSFLFSFIIFIVTWIANLFNYYTFINWIGAMLATIFLGFLCYLERRSNSDILRLYRTTQLCLDKIKNGKERLSTYKGFAGDTAGNSDSVTEAGERTASNVSNETERYSGSDKDGTDDDTDGKSD